MNDEYWQRNCHKGNRDLILKSRATNMFSQKGFRPSQLSLVPNNVLKGPLMSTYWLHTDSYFHPSVCWFYLGSFLLERNISSSVQCSSYFRSCHSQPRWWFQNWCPIPRMGCFLDAPATVWSVASIPVSLDPIATYTPADGGNLTENCKFLLLIQSPNPSCWSYRWLGWFDLLEYIRSLPENPIGQIIPDKSHVLLLKCCCKWKDIP